MRVTKRNAAFQQWAALGHNRSTRHRLGAFLVQGVRPIEQAVSHGWPLRAVLYRPGRLSAWAQAIVDHGDGATRVEVAEPLLASLGERDDGPPEILAVVAIPPDDLGRIVLPGGNDAVTSAPRPALVIVADRPASPGNLGSLVRSADSLGAAGVIVTGHAADLYDPKAVRSSRGSLFAIPVVRADGPARVTAWLADEAVEAIALDENGTVDLWDSDLTGRIALVIGNEASGLSATWRDVCTRSLRIPIGGSASSLNLAVSGSVALYEAARQRARRETQTP